jgi:hypothetical protein
MAIATHPSGSSRNQSSAPSIKRCVDATVQAATASTSGSADTSLTTHFAITRLSFLLINGGQRHGKSLRSRAYRPQSGDHDRTRPLGTLQFLFATEAFGCWQSAIASRPSTTLSRIQSPRISLRSSSDSK